MTFSIPYITVNSMIVCHGSISFVSKLCRTGTARQVCVYYMLTYLLHHAFHVCLLKFAYRAFTRNILRFPCRSIDRT